MADNDKPFISDDVLMVESTLKIKSSVPNFLVQLTSIIRTHLQVKLVDSGYIYKDWSLHYNYISHNWFEDGTILIKAGACFLNEDGIRSGLIPHPQVKKVAFRIRLADDDELFETDTNKLH